jgi:predicted MFS family arabinose efflux permease
MNEKNMRWAFLCGNFVIGTGVMLVPGMLNIMAADLGVSVPAAGVLISLAAAVLCIGAPVLATLTSRWDRRALLAGSLAFYALGHALCALMPGYAALLPVRAAIILGAATFTPQAAATLGLALPPERRAAGITFIFLGWSMASVIGLPLAAWLGAHLGWRGTFAAFAGVALLSALWVWQAVPRGLKGAALSLQSWLQVARSPVLVGVLAVTLLSASGQFTVWAYVAPYTHALLKPTPELFSGLLVWLGLCGVVGNVVATRAVARTGAALNVHIANALMMTGIALLMVLGGTLAGYAFCALLWGLGIFAANSSQQARLAGAAPELAGASIALNTSMIYLGQAIGTTAGGAVIAASGYGWLPAVAALLLLIAVYASMRIENFRKPALT